MKILAIETSCDETGAAVVEEGTKILSNVTVSSLPEHVKTGGIIPEKAAREQSKAIIPVLREAIESSKVNPKDLAAIAVTYGPGLIGSLLVGVGAAKALSYAWNKPLIPVNHLFGHLYASWLDTDNSPQFPLIALIVSGGHTELLFMKDHNDWKYLGGTRDDAAGEAFDKVGRLLNLGYPGGPAISKAAEKGAAKKFPLPRPLIDSKDYDFSFSGLKTAVSRLVESLENKVTDQVRADIAASFQEAVVETLLTKSLRAAEEFKVKNLILGGGVSANRFLRERAVEIFPGQVHIPPISLSTDNAAMIGSAAFFQNHPVDWREVKADPSLLF